MDDFGFVVVVENYTQAVAGIMHGWVLNPASVFLQCLYLSIKMLEIFLPQSRRDKEQPCTGLDIPGARSNDNLDPAVMHHLRLLRHRIF